MRMANLLFLAEAANSETSGEPESIPTLGDAVHELTEDPEGAFSALGKFFGNLLDALLGAIPSIILAIVVLIVGLILTKLSVKLLSKGLSKTKLELTVIKFTTQVARIILYVLLVTVVLSILGIPSTSIITVIGTAGVAIGLALQNSLSNVAGGFLLMLTKPFKIGDYIISNGVEGTVSQISILHTRLDSISNQAIFVPNGQVVNAVVINNSGNDTRRVDLKFSISYNDDYAKARDLIMSIVEKHPMALKTPAPFVRMVEHGASSIGIAARVWVKTADYWDVYFDLTEQVREGFIENEIEIPFDQLDVHVVDK